MSSNRETIFHLYKQDGVKKLEVGKNFEDTETIFYEIASAMGSLIVDELKFQGANDKEILDGAVLVGNLMLAVVSNIVKAKKS